MELLFRWFSILGGIVYLGSYDGVGERIILSVLGKNRRFLLEGMLATAGEGEGGVFSAFGEANVLRSSRMPLSVSFINEKVE